jgi:hypothetical protein
MKSRAIYLRRDDLHRQEVLKSAGYEIAGCTTLTSLLAALKHQADLVIIGDFDCALVPCAVAIVREQSQTPIVWFRNPLDKPAGDVDLVIEGVSQPTAWLRALERLLRKGNGTIDTVRLKKAAVGERATDKAHMIS